MSTNQLEAVNDWILYFEGLRFKKSPFENIDHKEIVAKYEFKNGIMKEHEFNCPYCFNEISTWVETTKVKQQFIEDCIECRNPLEMVVDCTFGLIQKIMINPIAQ